MTAWLQSRFPQVRAWAFAALATVFVALSPAQAAAPAKGPAWAELTADQQQILEPLKPEWDRMERQRRVKWIGIAKRYPKMSSKEQQRVQTRMQRWAKLTPEQRAAARKNYRNNVGALPPEKKKELKAQWQQYLALPENEKRSLAAKSADPREPRSATPSTRSRSAAGQGGSAR